jgi:hypothetical protein
MQSPHLTTSGAAERVVVMGPQQAVAYAQVYARLDADHGVIHILSADAQIHYLTVPIGCTLVEWQDASPLRPQPWIPAFASGAFGAMGEQMERMLKEMGDAFGPGGSAP